MIGQYALCVSERRIVNDGGLLAASGIDVAIHRIKAGVANAADKPAAVNSDGRIKNFLRLLEPVDSGGRFAPKSERIALPARIDLVITAFLGVPWRAPPAGEPPHNAAAA